jgi:hypothetical protein
MVAQPEFFCWYSDLVVFIEFVINNKNLVASCTELKVK